LPLVVFLVIFLWSGYMLTFDIPININISAATEEEAEQFITKCMAGLVQGAALERAVNHWDFIEFVTGDEYDS